MDVSWVKRSFYIQVYNNKKKLINKTKKFMNEQIPMGVDPKIKKELNDEGFDENAALLIGKKEEMPKLKERLESEGKTKDLGTYIELHKELSLPNEEIDNDDLKKEMMENKRQYKFRKREYVIDKGLGFVHELIYIDKDGNLSRVFVDINKIKDFDVSNFPHRDGVDVERFMTMRDKLKELGFMNRHEDGRVFMENKEREKYKTMWDNIEKAEKKYHEKLEEKSRDKIAKEFYF